MLNCMTILAKIRPDGELSAAAYVILAVMFLIIVGGLSWCFYRALKAAGKNAADQLPNDV